MIIGAIPTRQEGKVAALVAPTALSSIRPECLFN
jgi:hypothetical protein